MYVPCRPSEYISWIRGLVKSCPVHTIDLISPIENIYPALKIKKEQMTQSATCFHSHNKPKWNKLIVYSLYTKCVRKFPLCEKPPRNLSQQLSGKYQKAAYCRVRRRDRVIPIMSNHNQKSIFSNSLLEETMFIESDRFVFPEMGYICLWKQHKTA